MAKLIQEDTLSEAWLAAMEHLSGSHEDPRTGRKYKGRELNLVVVMNSGAEHIGVRRLLDAFYVKHASTRLCNINRVADTIFPADFYLPGEGDGAEKHVYEMQRLGSEMESRAMGRTYFDRMISWPTATEPYNQIQTILNFLRDDRMRAERRKKHRKNSNKFEIGIDPVGGADVQDAEFPLEFGIRTQKPGEDMVKNLQYPMFPCLSHVSLTLFESQLSMTAIYRNQHFLAKAYGNYVGLRNLQWFLANESGYVPGELACVATHADGEFGSKEFRQEVLQLLRDCRHAVDGP